MKERVKADVAVIGAGVSGLRAATLVAKSGRRVIVLEARDRVGGRIHSVPFAGGVVDVGAQWLGPRQDRSYRLVSGLGLSTFPQHASGRRLLDLDAQNAPLEYRSPIPPLPPRQAAELALSFARLEVCRRLVSLQRPWQGARCVRWDQLSVAEWLRRHNRTPEARALGALGTQMLLAADPEDVSLLYFLFTLQSGGGISRMADVERGAQRDRIVGGAQQLALGLAAELGDRVRSSAPVRRISQDASGVAVEADGVSVRATRVILALAPALAARIEYQPALPNARRDYQANMPMGSAMKCIVAYERAFWRDRGLRGEAISTGFPCRAFFDNCGPTGDHPALLGLAVGGDARRLAALPEAARSQAVIAQLVRLFGEDARRASAYLDHDWMAESWSGGCYAGVLGPGVMTRAGPARWAACGRIHFAGTESAQRWAGYIEGALDAAERAAAAVCAADA